MRVKRNLNLIFKKQSCRIKNSMPSPLLFEDAYCELKSKRSTIFIIIIFFFFILFYKRPRQNHILFHHQKIYFIYITHRLDAFSFCFPTSAIPDRKLKFINNSALEHLFIYLSSVKKKKKT